MAMIGSPAEQRSGLDAEEPTASSVEAVDDPADEPVAATEAETTDSAALDETTEPASEADSARAEAAETAPKSRRGRQAGFMAELARAMHAAAEAERVAVMERSRQDAHAFAEQVQARSAEESTALKRSADGDVATIRDWSKAEIARIREETERRIAARRRELDAALERHATAMEREMERVQERIAAFETQMASFFERLLEEEDPSRFAALASSLPEPPSFDEIDSSEASEAGPDENVTIAIAEAPGSDLELDGGAPESAELESAPSEPFAARAEAEAPQQDAVVSAGQSDEIGQPDAPESAESPAAAGERAGMPHENDLSFAEAEAAAAADAADDGGASERGDERNGEAGAGWAARLAGLVSHGQAAPIPTEPANAATVAETEVTQVVVVGLVSVASIAAFKRQLAHVPGVNAVGVSSGPDGEFVFRATHGADVVLRDVVPSMPGFQARVVRSAPGIVHVSARDPEAES